MTSVAAIQADHQARVGTLLRGWRERRMLTQMELALRAGISARHLSFIETGRSRPTSEMVLRLADHLDVPLRERNVLLLSAGYAPAFPASRLEDPPMRVVHKAIEHVLRAHEPFPAVVIDGQWELVAGNSAAAVLSEGAADALLEPPVNVMRLSLHPAGMARRIVNLAEWRAHLLSRLSRDIESTAAPGLIALREELAGYPCPPPGAFPDTRAILVPLQLRTAGPVISLISTTTVFGTPRDVTLSELAIESFYPADARTADYLRTRAAR
ncbi:MAG TPA: helix-turn-helix transcriptional regulator, partial [Trebonia sp.]|nr:helix-turn-helix transcriptional regulator [Trebonia sp.]